ncbi:FAD-dependent oxidoreductase [Streptomyces alfalfae]
MSTVVVVGAGIVGSSVAYHLARRGVPVTLLEQGPAPATGTTADAFAWIGSAGGHWPGGAQDLREYVLADYRRLESELPHLTVRRTGSLSWTRAAIENFRPGAGRFRVGRPSRRRTVPVSASPHHPCGSRRDDRGHRPGLAGPGRAPTPEPPGKVMASVCRSEAGCRQGRAVRSRAPRERH